MEKKNKASCDSPFMSNTRSMDSIVMGTEVPIRLDLYLSKRFTYMSRSRWQKEIQKGSISVNHNVEIKEHRKVRTGDKISFTGRNIEEPPVDNSYEILYKDPALLAVNKSGDMPVHPSGRYFFNTLQMILQNDLKEELFPVHRLDRETSGCILFARDKNTAFLMQKELKKAKKEYLAIVHGSFPEPDVTCTVPIGPARNSAVRKKREAYKGAPENALTQFKTVKSLGPYSIISARLGTGRTHQIRVHLKYLGCPIIGDKLYGIDEKFFLQFINNGMNDELAKKLILQRSALHSRRIVFNHPTSKKTVRITAPLPKLFIDFMKKKTN